MAAGRRALRTEVAAAGSARGSAVAAKRAIAIATLTLIAIIRIDRRPAIVTENPAPIFQFHMGIAHRVGEQDLIDGEEKVIEPPIGQGPVDR
jgi:hypothetical protein